MSMEICPRCHQFYSDYPAISRRDDNTPICSLCGQEEAIVDLAKFAGEEIPHNIAKRELDFAVYLIENPYKENSDE